MKNKIKKIHKKWWFIITIVIIIGGIYFVNTMQGKTQTNKNNKTKEIIFLKNTNSDEFAKHLKTVTSIKNIHGIDNGKFINYSAANDKYTINISANKKTKEINYVRIISLTNEESTNVFMVFNEMNYKKENDKEFTKWLTKNIGKKSTKKIGDANFKLNINPSKQTFIEMKTDNYNK